ncbi:hypothetical protein KIN20_032042 [Parelaphostrongylus tenuis]|uniref:Uncharacterized protein n=1 Tax=Parelaphostrongylus tenuis TaxID=148309 RepID=A0AAD5R6C7_PARTN|nr:hypothetical protein KIN20_032042 [Parelaphostrongylus tenuis]
MWFRSSEYETGRWVDEVVATVDAEMPLVIVLLILNQIVRLPTIRYDGRSGGDTATDDLQKRLSRTIRNLFQEHFICLSAHFTKHPLLSKDTADVVLAPREQELVNFHSQPFATDDDRSVLDDAIRANVSHEVGPIDHDLCGVPVRYGRNHRQCSRMLINRGRRPPRGNFMLEF